jgi:dTDP-4-amino-4,6-dideoxygalactose transaminase
VIPRLKPLLGTKEILAALHLPRKDDVIRFEKKFARLMDQKYALAFPYGRTGLMLLLKALEIKNKEIICPAYTCVVVPHAIVYSGNTPVFVDCEPQGFNMDLEKAEDIITDKTGALIATSIFGYPVNLDKLDKIRKKHPQVHIIQDCAHSFAAEWKGRPVQKEGIAALFGLNISKLLTSIFGGMITADDKALVNKLKQLRDNVLSPASWKKSIRRLIYFLAVYPTFSEGLYGIINRLERAGFLNQFVKYYDEFTIDMPSDYLEAMTNVEARVGRANLKRYHEILKNHIEGANHYFTALKNYSGFKLPPQISGSTYSHFAVKVKNRNGWLQKGINCTVQLGWLIEYCVPLMKPYGEHSREQFPEAAKYAETIINLPVWGGAAISSKVVQKISNIIKKT